MTTTRYWLSSPSTKVWILVLILCSALAVMTTLYYGKVQSTRELDEKIAKMVLDAGREFCMKIKSRNYLARASGLEIQSGCAPK